MSPYIDDPDFTLHVGDALETLQAMPAESVHCCVTSPPYWGLRDYGTGTWEGGDADCDHIRTMTRDQSQGGTRPQGWDGNFRNTAQPLPMAYSDVCGKCGATRVDQQLGLEPTPDQYVASMVDVFREVRRVLRTDGTLWLNIGDSYARAGGWSDNSGLDGLARGESGRAKTNMGSPGGSSQRLAPNLKEKDLCGIPWMLAFALRADGWYLRSDIIWSKPNPMPESVTDRPTKAHEYLFLLTKSPRYFYDADAIREPARDWGQRTRDKGKWYGDDNNGDKPYKPGGMKDADFAARGRNKRSVWMLDEETPTLQSSREAAELACGVEAVEAFGNVKSFYTKFGKGLERAFCLAVGGTLGVPPEPDVSTRLGWWEFRTQGNTKNSKGAAADADKVESGHMVQLIGSPNGGCISGVEFLRLHGVSNPDDVAYSCIRQAFREARSDGDQLSLGSDLWEIATAPYPDAHFATFPQALVEPCVKAGCPEDGVVLDPFLGSGTTSLVARRLGRRCVGIELNREYAQLAARRLQQLSLFA